MKKLLLLLLFVPIVSFGQFQYGFEINKEVSASFPSEEVYYDTPSKYSESLFNDDFELKIMVFTGKSYDEYSDLSDYIDEVVEDSDFINGGIFMKKKIRTGITSQYSTTYSKEEECVIIYGVIQDVISKKLYDIQLYCLNLSTKEGGEIINSIQIN